MPLGYDRETWRTIVLLTVATLALGVLAGLFAYIAYDSPEDVTCADLQTDPSERTRVAREVAVDLDVQSHPADSVADIVADEIGQACAQRSPSHRPVNSDLRGTIRQRLGARAPKTSIRH
jgi:hypothetical protein